VDNAATAPGQRRKRPFRKGAGGQLNRKRTTLDRSRCGSA